MFEPVYLACGVAVVPITFNGSVKIVLPLLPRICVSSLIVE